MNNWREHITRNNTMALKHCLIKTSRTDEEDKCIGWSMLPASYRQRKPLCDYSTYSETWRPISSLPPTPCYLQCSQSCPAISRKPSTFKPLCVTTRDRTFVGGALRSDSFSRHSPGFVLLFSSSQAFCRTLLCALQVSDSASARKRGTYARRWSRSLMMTSLSPPIFLRK